MDITANDGSLLKGTAGSNPAVSAKWVSPAFRGAIFVNDIWGKFSSTQAMISSFTSIGWLNTDETLRRK